MKTDKTDRLVRITNISYSYDVIGLSELSETIDKEGERGVDLIVLPETCRGPKMENRIGNTDPSPVECGYTSACYALVFEN